MNKIFDCSIEKNRVSASLLNDFIELKGKLLILVSPQFETYNY